MLAKEKLSSLFAEASTVTLQKFLTVTAAIITVVIKSVT